MNEKIKNLIIKNTIRDIQIRLLKAKEQGRIINERAVNEILFEIEAPIIVEGAEAEAEAEAQREGEIRDQEIEHDSIMDAVEDNK